jgi:tetratricopeptide (TPR) repeat protein
VGRGSNDSRVFLVGAGISRDAPSVLDSAPQIASRLARELTGSDELAPYRPAVAEAADSLRLELLLDLLAMTIGPRVAERVFAPMVDALPNFNHLALAYLGAPIITTNQDVQLEKGARLVRKRLRVRHVHGDCRHPRRIVARLSQYVHGLHPDSYVAIRDLVAGHELVVIGYSGRDLDVMQGLLQTSPVSITWVSPSQKYQGREVGILEQRLGSAFQRVRVPADVWLEEQLAPGIGDWLRSLLVQIPTPAAPNRAGHRAIGRARPMVRALAAAAVLERGDHLDTAFRLLEQTRRRFPSHPAVALALARCWLQRDRYDMALSLYQHAHREARDDDVRISSLQGEAESLRRSSRYAEAYVVLGELDRLQGMVADRLSDVGWAQNARAGLLRMEGRAIPAHAAYARAERAFAASGDLDGLIEVRTWRAENLVQIGAVESGLRVAERALADTVDFGRWFTAGWPLFVVGEGLGYRGQFGAAQASLRDAERRFRDAHNESGRAWAELLSAAFDRPHRLDSAERKLDRAERYLRAAQARGWTWIHVEARLALERAEVARARDSRPVIQEALAGLLALLDRESLDQPILRLHAALVAAEVRRSEGNATAAADLEAVCAGYRKLGLVGPAARAATAAWLVAPSQPQPERLVRLCQRHFPLEAERLSTLRSDYYPIYFV